MQFRLANLFTLTAIAGVSLTLLMPFRHWDLRSYYVGFYGRGADIPDWATGSGGDQFSESLGSLMAGVWEFAPWIALFGVVSVAGAFALQVKGGRR